jgi:hemoglobin
MKPPAGTRLPDPSWALPRSDPARYPRDLHGEADLRALVEAFYEQVRGDERLGELFDQVAAVDWPRHLDKMVAFWGSVLFSNGGYHGDPMAAHLDLAARDPFGEVELTRWLTLFRATVDARFEGPNAERAKQSAERIAGAIGRRLAAPSEQAGRD